jgi:hypothetical protein
MDKSQYGAASALGSCQMQSAAILLWREAQALNPAMTLVRVNLAKALLRLASRAKWKEAGQRKTGSVAMLDADPP